MNEQDILAGEPASKSIDIIDQTPEAENLIGGAMDDSVLAQDPVAEAEAAEPVVAEAPAEVAPVEAPVEPVAEPAAAEPVITEPVVAEEPRVEAPKAETPKANVDIKADPEHAFDESNEEYFKVTREKLMNLRRERNETIVQLDKKEDELTLIERENNQYANRGIFEKIEHKKADELRNEIYNLHSAINSKDRTIDMLSNVLRTL